MLRIHDLAAFIDDLATWMSVHAPGRLLHRRRRLARLRHLRRLRRLRLEVEQLEDRTLLSASIFGNVFGDALGTGVQVPTDPGVPSQVVYLDLNGNGQLDSTVNTVADASPSLINLGGVFASPLNVSGLAAQVTDVAINLNVSNNTGAALPVVLLSPTGLSLTPFNGPYLVTLQPGQSFTNLTIDGNALPTVNDAGSLVDGGTYGPQQAFNTPQTFIDSSNPNGLWALLFLPPSGSSAGLTLNSWSIRFTQPEPSTETDAAGNYSFTGLTAGTYTVHVQTPPGDVVTTPVSQTVTVADGAAATGVDFGLQPAPDLRGVSFTLAAPATAWGQNVTVNYTLTNQGAGNAPAFTADLLLSDDGVISDSGPLLDTLDFAPLAAGASVSGSATVALPATAPGGFDSVSTAYVGLVIDPEHSVTEANPHDTSNLGAGIDLAQLGPQLNEAVSSGADAQQDPSIAVDPNNPQHLVSAYMDYSLLSDGYAGIRVAVSEDGGQTWTNTSIPLPAGFSQGAATPSVGFDASGNVYLSFLAIQYLGGVNPPLVDGSAVSPADRVDGFQSNNGIFLAKSSDGGLSWGTPVPIDENVYTGSGGVSPTQDPNAVPFDEYPSLAVDTIAGSPYYGSLYVSWTRFYPGAPAAAQNQYPGGDPSSDTGGSDVMIAVSRDAGATWSTQVQASGISAIRDLVAGPIGGGEPAGNGWVKYSAVTVGAGGAVYVSADTGGYFAVYASTDGGQSFTPPSVGGAFGGNYEGNPFDYTQTGVLPDPTLDNFTTFRTRAIAADPTRPGVLYAVAPSNLAQAAAEPNDLAAANGIVFAVSTDYGASWTSNFTVGSEASILAQLTPAQINSGYMPVLNDDNGGAYPGFAASLQDQVVATQEFPSISVSPTGTIAVIWYDTRSDPSGTDLEVWGTVSTDGGQHFSANFPVSNAEFNPNAGAFTDPSGNANYSLGTQIGLVTTGTTAYAVWTDTRNGSQQVFSGNFSLNVPPAAPTDRFAPDYTQQTAANLGTITAPKVLPLLSLLPGQGNEWFSLVAGATGQLTVSVAGTGGMLRVELTDASGNVLPVTATDVLDASGNVVGERLVAASVSGTTYYVHVAGQSSAGIGYTLTAAALTGDFGTEVEGSTTGTVAAGGAEVYRLVAGVNGTLTVTLAGGADVQGDVNLTLLAADGSTVLASDLIPIESSASGAAAGGAGPGQSEELCIQVTAGQVVFLEVSGPNLFATADFTLQFTNLDQSETLSAPPQGSGATADYVAGQGFVQPGQTPPPNDYLLTVGLTGTLQVTLTGGGGLTSSFVPTASYTGALNLSILGADGHQVLTADDGTGVGSGQSETLSLSVTAGEVVYLQVAGAQAADFAAGFTIQFADLAATTGQTLFFPTTGTPNSLAAADLSGNGVFDLIASSTTAGDTVSVLTGNGDGTFQPEKQYDVGPGQSAGLLAGQRPIIAVPLTAAGTPDVIVPNFNAAGISVLLSNADGTLQPQRLFNAVADPSEMAAGDFTGNGITDLVVRQSFTNNGPTQIAVLIGRGDGTFEPPVFYTTAFSGAGADGPMVVGDFTGNGRLDIVLFDANQGTAQLFLGNGDGTFTNGGTFATGEGITAAAALDLTGNGITDLVCGGANTGNVYVLMGNGNGTFQPPVPYQTMTASGDVIISSMALVDFGSPGSATTPDGIPDIVITAAPRANPGAAEVIELPGNGDGTFGTPLVLAHVGLAGSIVAGDFGNGATDLAVANTGGVTVIYSTPLTVPPNTTLAAARDLGDALHLATQPQAIVTGNEDAYYRYTVPTEAVSGAGSEVIDVSAQFADQTGAGLSMQILDSVGDPLAVLQTATDATGMRIRVDVPQGQSIIIHVFGVAAVGGNPGTGVVTLDVDTLPQLVSVQAESALPGGPVTSIVLTLQGDRLDPATAQNPANYTITWDGPDGAVAFTPSTVAGSLPVVYTDSASLDVTSGLTYPTAVRQTITLLFDQPLPAGTYTLTLSSAIQAAPLSDTETAQLVGGAAFAGHPVVQVDLFNDVLTSGSTLLARNLVAASTAPGNLNTLHSGTAFLTELHDDLGTLLDSFVEQEGDATGITAALNNQVQAFFGSVLGSNVPVAIIWLDPVSLALADSQGARTTYNLASNTTSNTSAQTFMQTGGSIEVMVLAGVTGALSLNIADVAATARGGAVIIDDGATQSVAMTDAIRGGTRDFEFNIPNDGVAASSAAADGSVASALGGFGSITVPLLALTLSAAQVTVTATNGAPAPTGRAVEAAETAAASGDGSVVAMPVLAGEQAFEQYAEVINTLVPGSGIPLLLFRAAMRTAPNELPRRPNLVPVHGADRPNGVRPAGPEEESPEASVTPPNSPVRPEPAAAPATAPAPAPTAVPVAPQSRRAQPVEGGESVPAAVVTTDAPRVRISAVLGVAIVTLGIYQSLYREPSGPRDRRPQLPE